MSEGVWLRILERCRSVGTGAVVVVAKAGRPGQVFDLQTYLKQREHAARVRPWEHRKRRARPATPLGTVDGTVLSSLGRRDIYE